MANLGQLVIKPLVIRQREGRIYRKGGGGGGVSGREERKRRVKTGLVILGEITVKSDYLLYLSITLTIILTC